MTTTYHTPIATGAAANASTINTPLGQLDAAIVALEAVYGLDGAIAGPITVTGNTTIAGTMSATTLLGDGSALTGIGSGTGGIINTGSTTIGADSDADGAGEIALQTRGVTRMTIANAGSTLFTGSLGTSNAKIHAAQNISPASGAQAAMYSDATCYDNTGSQWASMFARVYTTAGESMATNQLDGLLTALYHTEETTVLLWKGVETGGAFIGTAGVSTAACRVETAYGLDANIPTLYNDATAGTVAAIHIAILPTAQMDDVYAIKSDLPKPSSFAGPINVTYTGTELGLTASRTGGTSVIKNTSYYGEPLAGALTNGARLRLQFSRWNTTAEPDEAAAVEEGDMLGNVEAYGNYDGTNFANSANVSFYVPSSCTISAASTPANILFRTVADTSTTLTTRMTVNHDGKVGIGLTTGFAGQLHVKQPDAGAVPVLYLEQADVDQEFIRFKGASAADNTQSLVDAADLEDPGAVVGWVRIYVVDDTGAGGIADGAYWMPFYATPTHSP